MAEVEATIANLLDNITPGTRDLAEQRLSELRHKREEFQLRATELERLVAQHRQVDEMAHEVSKFLNSLEFTLGHGLPEETRLSPNPSWRPQSADR